MNARSALMSKSILDSAAEIFDERGYAETRMQDIADAMGVTRPSLYYYFKNKEEILVALLLDLVSSDKVLEGLADESVTPYERLSTLMRRIGAQVADQPARLRIINRNFAQIPETFRDDFAQQRQRVRASLTQAIRAAIAAGDVRPIDPELTTSIIFGAITGIADWYHPTSAITAEETVEAITTMLLSGITVPPEGRHDGTPRGVIQRISEDLAYLEQLTATNDTSQTRPRPAEAAPARAGSNATRRPLRTKPRGSGEANPRGL
ncbi:TetR/AcrR family transcriptional regulator [Streptosporangium sp. NPDC087985]|uniref:TetR/AcrR family transcriptional regulator n=1 Tax=Streptosporangium sp. NPDC087985 TaxID=3366196 RepID=UPI0037FDA754